MTSNAFSSNQFSTALRFYPISESDFYTSLSYENSYDGIKDPNFTHCNNRNEWITHEFNEKIDKISKGIPNFYVGRYDIRFSDIEKFKKGEDIKVLELNGTMGYDLRATLIPKLSFRYICLCLRFILVRLLVGMENVLLLNAVNPFSLIINQIKRFTKIRQCSNYHIFRPSEL